MRRLYDVTPDDLAMFEQPIQSALANYQDLTGGQVLFDIEAASRLALTPDKTNSARSSTDVFHDDELLPASFTVIMFAPGDTTGSDVTYKVGELNTGGYPDDPSYFPRSKSGVHTEAHLTLASRRLVPGSKPVKGAGHLSMLGLVGVGNNKQAKPLITEIGYVGQESHAFSSIMIRTEPRAPRTTFTTGYRANNEGRFGDPHAMINDTEYAVQVCGFLAIKPEMAERHLDIFPLLHARMPRQAS